MIGDRVFCHTCRSIQEVMDTYLTDDWAGGDRVAMPLECSHDATDGGGSPYRSRPPDSKHTKELIDRVVGLQKGAYMKTATRDSATTGAGEGDE